MDKVLHEEMRLRKLQSVAFNLIDEKFKGKVDKGGRPYVHHCYRVADAVEHSFGEQPEEFQIKCIIAALLHDIIEDTEVSKHDLLLQFDQDVVEAVEALSRQENESYYDFIVRCKQNEIAKIVKRYDLEDNMDIKRLSKFGDHEHKRLEKYWYSWRFIKDEINEHEYFKAITNLNNM